MRLSGLFLWGACLAVLAMLSGCGCTAKGCAPALTFIVSSTANMSMLSGSYRLQLNQGAISTVIECPQGGTCQQESTALVLYGFDSRGLVFSLFNPSFPGDRLSFSFSVNETVLQTGETTLSHKVTQPNGPYCGDCTLSTAQIFVP